MAPDDLNIKDAAALVGRCEKTLRRAVSSAALARRYVLTPRGPQLVFRRADLEGWTAGRRHRRTMERRPRAHDTGDLATFLSVASQLQMVLDENRASIATLAARLRDEEATLQRAQSTISTLTSRLAQLEAALAERAEE